MGFVLTLKFATSAQKIIYFIAQKMFLLDSLEALYKHMTLIKLYFSRDRKLYLMEVPMIKPEEPK